MASVSIKTRSDTRRTMLKKLVIGALAVVASAEEKKEETKVRGPRPWTHSPSALAVCAAPARCEAPCQRMTLDT